MSRRATVLALTALLAAAPLAAASQHALEELLAPLGLSHAAEGDVAVPPQQVGSESPGASFDTPGASHSVATPPVEVEGQRTLLPGQVMEMTIPRLGAPATALDVPGLVVELPAVERPPVRLETPTLVLPAQEHVVDVDPYDLNVREVRGTLAVGPYGIPYRAGPFDVGEDDLPPEVPRRHVVATPAATVFSGAPLVERPGAVVVESFTYQVEGAHIPLTPEYTLLNGGSAGQVAVPGMDIGVPGLSVPAQTRTITVPEQRHSTPPLPGVVVETPGVVVLESGRPEPPEP